MKKSEMCADLDRRIARIYERITVVHQGLVRRNAILLGEINACRKATADLDERVTAAIAQLRSREPDRNGRLAALDERIADLERRMDGAAATAVDADIPDADDEQPAAEQPGLDYQILRVLGRVPGVWMTPGSVYLNLPDCRDAHQVRDHLGGLARRGIIEPHLADDGMLAYRIPAGERR